MKITIYELLGMVKDGKAPKKVKYGGIEYEFNGKDYINEFGVNLLQHLTYAEYIMTHKVEILEEEKKIPEKLKVVKDNSNDIVSIIYDDTKYDITILQAIIIDNINEIIDYLKNKGE